jgi:hypothetical protein
MRKFLYGLLMVSSTAFADSSSLNLALPNAGQSYGQDSIRAGDLDCKNSIGGSTNVEFGVTGILSEPDTFGDNVPSRTKDVAVYARIVIPLDGPEERINCNSLYKLELRKKRLEVLKLQEELEALKRLRDGKNSGFEN